MLRFPGLLCPLALALAITNCSTTEEPRGHTYVVPGGDSSSADTDMGDSATADQDSGDPAPQRPGETCQEPIILSFTTSPLVVTGDTSTMLNNYHFSGCVDATWSYQAEDLVYRLEAPAGTYLATLVPDHGYTYFSLLLIRTTGTCATFNTDCAQRSDADLYHLHPRIPFTVGTGEVVYLVVDSAIDPLQNEPGTYDGPFTLTIESFVQAGLGGECAGSYGCADDMVCFSPHDQPPGYCTDLCDNVDCDSGSVAMACRDLSEHPHYSDGSLACVVSADIGTLSLGAECRYSFQCEPNTCVIPFAGDIFGECRIPCTDTCADADDVCVDVSDDLLEPVAAGTRKICTAITSIDTLQQGDDCIYSYECEDADICDGGLCMP